MNAAESEFLKPRVPAAQNAQRLYDVLTSITLAQAIIESGWGKSQLSIECNNDFGIKATHYVSPDEYRKFPTHEFVNGKEVLITASFKRYANLDVCFAAHARLIARSERYAPAMAVRHDPAAFARELQACGYSTNPKYAELLMQLVNEFDLTQYDLQPEPPAQAKQMVAA